MKQFKQNITQVSNLSDSHTAPNHLTLVKHFFIFLALNKILLLLSTIDNTNLSPERETW